MHNDSSNGSAQLITAVEAAAACGVWAIFDRSRVYINVGYPTEEAARLELSALLQPYPEGHEWRKRLRVKYVESREKPGGMKRA